MQFHLFPISGLPPQECPQELILQFHRFRTTLDRLIAEYKALRHICESDRSPCDSVQKEIIKVYSSRNDLLDEILEVCY